MNSIRICNPRPFFGCVYFSAFFFFLIDSEERMKLDWIELLSHPKSVETLLSISTVFDYKISSA